MKNLLYFLIVLVLFSSCSEYQKALKNEDTTVKLDMATKMYELGKYNQSLRLIEQIAGVYRGRPDAEQLFYMYAQSYYKTRQYYLAGYQFESFVSAYPKSDKVIEAAFLGAKSYSKLSPVFSLDQTDTTKAIEKLQLFIDNYPNSEFIAEANTITKTLNGKLEKKVFENAKGYNTISDFKSALIALDNFIADFPGTSLKEEALYYRLDSAYKLGVNSIPSKMEERLNVAKVAYANLIKFKPDTQYKQKADEMLVRIEKDLQNLLNK